MNKWAKLSVVAVLVLAAVLLPRVVTDLYWLHVLVMAGMMVIMASSLRAIALTGQMSLGHAGFMAIGGFGSALLVMKAHWPFWLAFFVGPVVAAVVAIPIGYLILRIKGLYFALLTLFIGEIIRLTAWNWKGLTGGSLGLRGVPLPSSLDLPGLAPIVFQSKASFYYLALALVLVTLIVLYRLEHTRIGLNWGAIREADTLAEAVGINITRYKVLVFAIGCLFAGLAGALWAHYLRIVSPGSFNLFMSLNVLIFVMVGGATSFAGPILGAVLLTIVPEVSRAVKEYQPIIFGGVLIFVMFFLPEGLTSLPGRLSQAFRRLRRWSGGQAGARASGHGAAAAGSPARPETEP